MKVLYVIPANVEKGEYKYSTFIKSEIEGLKLKLEGISIYYFVNRNSLSGFIESLRDLNKRLDEFDPDILHVHYGATTGFLGYLARKKCPWVITFGGSELLGHPNKGIKWRIRELFAVRLSRIAAMGADRIICVSKNLIDKLPISTKNKIVVIPRGVNALTFNPISKSDARLKLKWNEQVKYILFSLPRKNAAVKNKELADNVMYHLCSRTTYLIEMVILYGKTQAYLRDAFCAADALLVTSLHEGSPNIVKEAMACNLPIVSVPCGDVPERLENVTNSYVVDYDADLLAGALIRILDKGKPSNGRDVFFNQNLDIDSSIKRIMEVYNEII